MKKVNYMDENGKWNYRWEYENESSKPSWNMPNWLAPIISVGSIVAIVIFLL